MVGFIPGFNEDIQEVHQENLVGQVWELTIPYFKGKKGFFVQAASEVDLEVLIDDQVVAHNSFPKLDRSFRAGVQAGVNKDLGVFLATADDFYQDQPRGLGAAKLYKNDQEVPNYSTNSGPEIVSWSNPTTFRVVKNPGNGLMEFNVVYNGGVIPLFSYAGEASFDVTFTTEKGE